MTTSGVDAAAGRKWLATLPEELVKHRDLLARLLDLCEATPLVSSLSVGCSLGRGVADARSDVDAALGVDAARCDPGGERVSEVEQAAVVACAARGSLVDLLRGRVGPSDRFVRRVVAQFGDGLQLDLAVMAETEVRRGAAAPDFVALYRSSASPRAHDDLASPAPLRFPSAATATADQVHEWAFLAWWALADLDKYLHRRSLWEAHQRLHEARDRVWALWATAQGATYPWHGLSQVLDHDPDQLPPGIGATVAGLDAADLRRAASATADVLTHVSALAAARLDAPLPTGLAGYVRGLLSR